MGSSSLINNILNEISLFSEPALGGMGQELILTIQMLLALSFIKKLGLICFALGLFFVKILIFSLIKWVNIKKTIKPFIFANLIDTFLLKPVLGFIGAYLGIFLGNICKITEVFNVPFPIFFVIILYLFATPIIEFIMLKNTIDKKKWIGGGTLLFALNFFILQLWDK